MPAPCDGFTLCPWVAWRFGSTGAGECWTVGTADGRVLPESEANARLKAAAPDLYAMLEEVGRGAAPELRRCIAALLAAARGEG